MRSRLIVTLPVLLNLKQFLSPGYVTFYPPFCTSSCLPYVLSLFSPSLPSFIYSCFHSLTSSNLPLFLRLFVLLLVCPRESCHCLLLYHLSLLKDVIFMFTVLVCVTSSSDSILNSAFSFMSLTKY